MEINKTQSISSESKDDIYEVQEIVGMKKEGDISLYRVRWKGYGPQSDTWEPQSNLRTVWKMVEKYETKINKIPLVSSRRRGRPSNTSSITSKNNSTVDNTRDDSTVNVIKRENLSLTNIKLTNRRKIVNKKKIKNGIAEKSKDTFWKDLEEGKIDVFKEDLYSRVKSRASSRGNSMENSPKLSKDFDKCWPHSDSNDSENTDDYMDADMRLKYCKTEALIAAIKDCDLELTKILIKNGSDINSTFGKSSSTPLMIACEMNNVNMTQFLLMQGSAKDMQNKNGDTALIIACRLGFEQIIKLLLIYGSNFAIINKTGMNALRIAKLSPGKNIQDILVDHISKLTISLELQVMNMLCNTAKIVNALFPIQCYSISEGKSFKFLFTFDLEKCHRQPGVGYLLFVANASISNTDIKCKLSGPNTVQEVVLNGIQQKPMTEGAQFVFSFLPLLRGDNELIVNTIEAENSKIKLLVCAYEAQLITDSHYYKQDQCFSNISQI